MKRKTLLSLAILSAILIFQSVTQKAYADACILAQPTITVHQTIKTDRGTCISLIDFRYFLDINNGSKTLNFVLYPGTPISGIPVNTIPQYTELMAATYNGNAIAPVTTISIDNTYALATPASSFTQSNTSVQNLVFNDNWNTSTGGGLTAAQLADIDFQTYGGTVSPALYLTKEAGTVSGVSGYFFTMYNIIVEYPTPSTGCSLTPALTGASWGTQAADGTVSHCTSNPAPVPIAPSQEVISTYCINGVPQYQVQYSGSSTFSYDAYLDNGDGNYGAGDTKLTSTSVTGTGPFDSGSQPITGVTDPNNYKIYVVFTVDGKTTYLQALGNCTNYTPLPVNFGMIKASNSNGKLTIDFQTLTETNSKEFAVEASKDGVNWKEIGKLKSKANNGNTTETQNYQVSISLPISFAALSLALLLFLPAFKSRKTKILLMIAIVAIFTACAKNSKEDVNISKSENLFIRIAQHDLDGKVTYSKIIKVFND